MKKIKNAVQPVENSNAVTIFKMKADISHVAKMKKLTRPALVDIKKMPVGAQLDGELIAVERSFSKKILAKNPDARLLKIRLDGGTEIYFPYSGVVANAFGSIENAENAVGKTITLIRNPDQISAEYKKPMFMIDVYVGE